MTTQTRTRMCIFQQIAPVLLLFLLAGCSLRQQPEDPLSPTEREATTQDQAEAIDRSPSSVIIRPGTTLDIHVLVAGKREVDAPDTRVSETGTITLPLIGTVRIQGRSIQMVEHLVRGLYRQYFVNPTVTLDVVRDESNDASFPWGYVTVLGRVKQQGRVGIPPTQDMTVSSAIQQAGGFDTSARVTAIRVTRRTPDGETSTTEVNLKTVGTRGKTENDILLKPYDVVFVPELLF